MKVKTLKIGDLTARIPLIQGGMGVGISLSSLAGTVAKCGGIGVISTAQIGYREPDFYSNTLQANLRAINSEMKKAREIAHGGIIGFNIMVALNHYKEQVMEAVKAGADVIISGAGLPVKLPEYIGESNVKIAPIVSGEKAVKVILKYWHKYYGRTADFIVIEGPKAGVHLGFSKDEIIKYNSNLNFDDEVKKIKRVVMEYENLYGEHIPLILAGGIESKDDVQHVFDLEMDGIQVASKFVTTVECDGDIRYKNAYVSSNKEDITIVKSPVGMPGRAIMNSFMEKVIKGEKFPPSKCLRCLKNCNPKEIDYCITERLIAAAKGDIENALLFCGAKAYIQKDISTVKNVIDELF